MSTDRIDKSLRTADRLLRKQILTRHDLIYALTQAAQLEHALCCCYLFAGFSLKKNVSEGGVTWAELKHVRDWQTQLFIIARQEMGHLGLACNLLTAIGGAPHFRRPNFPYETEIFGTLPEFNLEPFSQEAIENFIAFESPEHIQLRNYLEGRLAPVVDIDEALGVAVDIAAGVMRWPAGLVCSAGSCNKVVSAPVQQSTASESEKTRRTEMLELLKQWEETTAATGSLPGWDYASDLPGRFYPAVVAFDGSQSSDSTTGDAGLVGAAVPVLGADRNVIAVLAFCYETYEHAGEDDDLVWALFQALNGSPFLDLCGAEPGQSGVDDKDDSDFLTIGEFYRHILGAFRMLDKQYSEREDEFFIGPKSAQVSNTDVNLLFPEWFNFDLTQVDGIESVARVITEIIREGEGTSESRDDSPSHYQRLKTVLTEFRQLKEANPEFDPVRPVVTNPTVEDGNSGTRITCDSTSQLLEVANDSYELMLRVLMRFYARPNPEDTNALVALSQIFLPMMSMVVRTLGEILTELPAFEGQREEVAGHGFELHQDLDLMPQAVASRKYFAERLRQLAAELARIEFPATVETAVAERLGTIAANLERIAFNFENAVDLRHENWGSLPREHG